MALIGETLKFGHCWTSPSASLMLVLETTLARAFNALVAALVVFSTCTSSAVVPFPFSQNSSVVEPSIEDNSTYSTDTSGRRGNAVIVNPPEYPNQPNGSTGPTTVRSTTSSTSSNGFIDTTNIMVSPSTTPDSGDQVFQPTLPFPMVITVQPPATPQPPPSSVQTTETVIYTITQPASTVTVQLPPATITSFITVTNTDISATPTTIISTTTHVEWSLPAQFTSLDDAFEIAHFAYGRENMQLVTADSVNIPEIIDCTGLGADACMDETNVGTGFERRSTNRTILQIRYPAGSYSPSHQPRGGADFYSSPSASSRDDISRSTSAEYRIDWEAAKNVTLSYAVYFPVDFDFVRGGKLPGLYGGHEKCSGGDDGMGCFSTRLMWRSGGKGELYLYAPRDRQPPSLCSTPPLSVCDSSYGLSVGRGSFIFPRAEWFWVRQTVWLNTPGVADGGFVLDVGTSEESMVTVLNNAEVFYRDKEGEAANVDGQMIVDDIYGEDDEPTFIYPGLRVDAFSWLDVLGQDTEQRQKEQQHFGTSKNSGDLPPVYSQNSKRINMPKSPVGMASSIPITTDDSTPTISRAYLYAYAVEGITTVTMANHQTSTVLIPVLAPTPPTPSTQSVSNPEYTGSLVIPDTHNGAPFDCEDDNVVGGHWNHWKVKRKGGRSNPVGFIGIFFSTFFGGSTFDWASPRDQNVWFSSFTVRINA